MLTIRIDFKVDCKAWFSVGVGEIFSHDLLYESVLVEFIVHSDFFSLGTSPLDVANWLSYKH